MRIFLVSSRLYFPYHTSAMLPSSLLHESERHFSEQHLRLGKPERLRKIVFRPLRGFMRPPQVGRKAIFMNTRRFLSSVFLTLCLFLGCLMSPAFASGGSGGSSSGGGGISTTTTTIPLSASVALNGGLPSGRATFTYSQDGSIKSMTIQLSNVDVADGDSVDVEIDDAWRVGNWVAHNYYYVPVTIYQGSGALSYSTANGDFVPFLLPAGSTTTITVWGNYTVWPGTEEIATGIGFLHGIFGALTRG
jgi:hypothetical protein